MVRVGTHALTATRKATLVGRLRQHRSHLAGRDPGGGNHRGSVFRRHVGAALIHRDGHSPALLASWLDRHGPHPGWASQETGIERSVSRNIGSMPVLPILEALMRGRPSIVPSWSMSMKSMDNVFVETELPKVPG